MFVLQGSYHLCKVVSMVHNQQEPPYSPFPDWIWKSQMEMSMAKRRGRPFSSYVSTASLERAIRLPGPISWYILQDVSERSSGSYAHGLTHEYPFRNVH